MRFAVLIDFVTIVFGVACVWMGIHVMSQDRPWYQKVHDFKEKLILFSLRKTSVEADMAAGIMGGFVVMIAGIGLVLLGLISAVSDMLGGVKEYFP